jgi:hypothetical protein
MLEYGNPPQVIPRPNVIRGVRGPESGVPTAKKTTADSRAPDAVFLPQGTAGSSVPSSPGGRSGFLMGVVASY